MAGNNIMRELASSVGFKGTPQNKLAEPSINRQLPVIDNSDPSLHNVRTSIDVYVSGQYLGPGGKTVEVIQRYTVFAAYSKRTQHQTMQQVREQVLQDFQAKYGSHFNISNIRLSGGATPLDQAALDGAGPAGGGAAPEQFYLGSGVFSSMTRTDRERFDIGSQSSIARKNVGSIRKRYSGV